MWRRVHLDARQQHRIITASCRLAACFMMLARERSLRTASGRPSLVAYPVGEHELPSVRSPFGMYLVVKARHCFIRGRPSMTYSRVLLARGQDADPFPWARGMSTTPTEMETLVRRSRFPAWTGIDFLDGLRGDFWGRRHQQRFAPDPCRSPSCVVHRRIGRLIADRLRDDLSYSSPSMSAADG